MNYHGLVAYLERFSGQPRIPKSGIIAGVKTHKTTKKLRSHIGVRLKDLCCLTFFSSSPSLGSAFAATVSFSLALDVIFRSVFFIRFFLRFLWIFSAFAILLPSLKVSTRKRCLLIILLQSSYSPHGTVLFTAPREQVSSSLARLLDGFHLQLVE